MKQSFRGNMKYERALFAGGCFWGVEYYMKKEPGVISTRVGYTGGKTENPSYKDICAGKTGHIETVEIIFDPERTTYRKLAKLFFEIHDPTQLNQQGPDIGDQYRSAIFYMNDHQKKTIKGLIRILLKKGYQVVTKLQEASTFWEAEEHQKYYDKNGTEPYCHGYVKRF